MGDMIVICPKCSGAMELDPDALGKSVRCPLCGFVFPARLPKAVVVDPEEPVITLTEPAPTPPAGASGTPVAPARPPAPAQPVAPEPVGPLDLILDNPIPPASPAGRRPVAGPTPSQAAVGPELLLDNPIPSPGRQAPRSRTGPPADGKAHFPGQGGPLQTGSASRAVTPAEMSEDGRGPGFRPPGQRPAGLGQATPPPASGPKKLPVVPLIIGVGAVVVIGIVLIAALTGGGGTQVTRANFDRIKRGMTLAEVEAILGGGSRLPPAAATTRQGTVPSAEYYAWGAAVYIRAETARAEGKEPNLSEQESVQVKGVKIGFISGKAEVINQIGL